MTTPFTAEDVVNAIKREIQLRRELKLYTPQWIKNVITEGPEALK